MDRVSRACYKIKLKCQSWAMEGVKRRVQSHVKTLAEFRAGLPPSKEQPTLPRRAQAIVGRLGTPDAMKNRMREWCEKEGSNVRGLQRWGDEIFSDVIYLWVEAEKAVWGIDRLRRRQANPPGHYMGWFANTFFTARTREFVIEPLIADYRREVETAIRNEQFVRERYLDLLYGYQFIKVSFGKAIWTVARLLISWH